MQPSTEGPQLSRVGSGRSARLGALVALVVLAGSAALALAERRPRDTAPQRSFAVVAPTTAPSPSPSPRPTRSSPPAALDRGNGWPPDRRERVPPFFDALLLNHERAIHRVRVDGQPGELSARLAIEPGLWHQPARLQLRWSDGRPDGRREQLALVRLSLGSSTRIGLPAVMAEGTAVLPQRMAGTRHWRYEIGLERAHDYSALDEWIATVRLVPTEPPQPQPAAQTAPLILLTASPWRSQRATRTHGMSWVAGR